MVEKLLDTLCKELSIFPVPAREKEGFFTFHFSQQIVIKIKDLEPGVGMSANITDCPKIKREELFIYLMRANLLGQGTGGCRIGLDANEKVLTLSLGLPYEMNYSVFKEKLEDFINYIVYWREEIEKFERQPQVLR